MRQIIKKYLSRFDEELQQINLKKSVGNKKNKSHNNREKIIRMTMERENNEYNTCGLGKTLIMSLKK